MLFCCPTNVRGTPHSHEENSEVFSLGLYFELVKSQETVGLLLKIVFAYKIRLS